MARGVERETVEEATRRRVAGGGVTAEREEWRRRVAGGGVTAGRVGLIVDTYPCIQENSSHFPKTTSPPLIATSTTLPQGSQLSLGISTFGLRVTHYYIVGCFDIHSSDLDFLPGSTPFLERCAFFVDCDLHKAHPGDARTHCVCLQHQEEEDLRLRGRIRRPILKSLYGADTVGIDRAESDCKPL